MRADPVSTVDHVCPVFGHETQASCRQSDAHRTVINRLDEPGPDLAMHVDSAANSVGDALLHLWHKYAATLLPSCRARIVRFLFSVFVSMLQPPTAPVTPA